MSRRTVTRPEIRVGGFWLSSIVPQGWGRLRHATRRCTSWALGSSRSSGGMYSANIPLARHAHVSPRSRVCQTPPVDTATVMPRLSRGSTQIEWIPGES